MSKNFRTSFGFALLCSVIGWQSGHNFLNQWEVKPIVNCSHAFSRAWRRLHVSASNSDWFVALFPSVVIGQVITLVFVLRHSIENLAILHMKALPVIINSPIKNINNNNA